MTETKKMNDVEAIEKLSEVFGTIKNEMAKIIVGQENIIEQLLISLFAKGHCLLIGVPAHYGLLIPVVVKSGILLMWVQWEHF